MVSNTFFLDHQPLKHQWNPSYQPVFDAYLGLPLIGDMQFTNGSNTVALNDLIFKGTNTVNRTFLHPEADQQAFLQKMNRNWQLDGKLQINLFDVGFRLKDDYFTFSVKERMQSDWQIPRDFFSLLMEGNGIDNKQFQFGSFAAQMDAWIETAFGYSHRKGNLSYGAKFKLLNGQMNVTAKTPTFDINTSSDEWNITSEGSLTASTTPMAVDMPNDSTILLTYFDKLPSYFRPYGFGLATDLGVNYTAFKNLNVGLSIRDLGFISWFRNTDVINYNYNFRFDGLQNLDVDRGDIGKIDHTDLDSITLAAKNGLDFTVDHSDYINALQPVFNLSAEYSMLKKKLSVGMMAEFSKKFGQSTQKFTYAVSGEPLYWLNLALTYTSYQNNLGLIGLGTGVKLGNVYLTAATDYFLPGQFAQFNLKAVSPSLPDNSIFLPYNSNRFNFAFGLHLLLNDKTDRNYNHIEDVDEECNCY